ncbi:hypothetical protein SAMN05428984_3085 [Sphingomonas sp. OK281]|nr:hypothetical protein SAMN05428984_3085 [Sphingomonas sp. OK281]
MGMDIDDRAAAVARWLDLTRTILPAVAPARRWPVRNDHCFQRIFLDNACEGVWYDHIAGRPAYAHAPRAILARAIALAETVLADGSSLDMLNRRSLAWRKARAAAAQRSNADQPTE